MVKLKFWCIGYVLGSLLTFVTCSGLELMHRAMSPDQGYSFSLGLGVGVCFTFFALITALMILLMGGDK